MNDLHDYGNSKNLRSVFWACGMTCDLPYAHGASLSCVPNSGNCQNSISSIFSVSYRIEYVSYICVIYSYSDFLRNSISGNENKTFQIYRTPGNRDICLGTSPRGYFGFCLKNICIWGSYCIYYATRLTHLQRTTHWCYFHKNICQHAANRAFWGFVSLI